MTNQEKLIEVIKEALELEEEISFEDSIDDFDNWDSLSKLSLIALLDEYFEVQISNNEFDNVDTLKDLLDLIQSKKQ
jgi:acyl carrier protein